MRAKIGISCTTCFRNDSANKLKIAVIGAGISGIAAAWNLQNHHDLTLYDRGSEIGGHAKTITAYDHLGKGWPVDTGFIVFNNKTYPLFNRFIDELGVQIISSDMSFSFTDKLQNVSYSGTLNGIIPELKKLADMNHLSTIVNIYKYSRILESYKNKNGLLEQSITEFLREIGCPSKTINNYFIPIASAIWSCDSKTSGNIPARTYIEFFSNHGLLGIRNRPKWYTIKGGSRTYLEEFKRSFNGTILTNTDINYVEEKNGSVIVKTTDGTSLNYDLAIVATDAQTASTIVRNLSSHKKRILEYFNYTKNRVILHTDTKFMPNNRRTWSSWNLIRDSMKGETGKTYTTYYMNRLQRFDTSTNFLVTLNPPQKPDESKIVFETTYNHPIITAQWNPSSNQLKDLNRKSRVRFCGAYLGFGFHEDGYRTGKSATDISKALTS